MIEKIFKLKFFLKFTAVVVLSTAFVIVALYLLVPESEVFRYAAVVASFMKTDNLLNSTIIISVIIEIILITFMVVLLSVFTSHKIVGPLYRIDKVIESLSSADVNQEVRFRKNDQIHNVAAIFNDVFKMFRERLNAIIMAHKAVEEARKKIDGTPQSVERLKEKVGILEKEIEKFTLQ